MYERSAIVLERYFENLLDYREDCNLRDNFNNYCELVVRLEKFQVNYQKEIAATQEYNASIKKIKSIQATQEKLYKKSAKLEYNRNLLFTNIDVKVEETKKCIEKIEIDVEKNNEEMKALKEELILALTEYNDKRFELSKCKRYKKMAENDYNEILEMSRMNFEGITQDSIENVKRFSKFDDNEDIIETLEKNGKDEKIPFNGEVMENATIFGVDVAKKEAISYLVMYDKMNKLLTDINSGTTRIELHKKYLRNEKAKIDFILAVKEYLVQFLDYERMTVIHGRKSHNRLMSEACENFNTDIIQINNLYDLLVKETTNKATKKAYKELYNKSYLIDIKEKEEKFKKEKNRVNLNTATLINSNYWRIEGIRNIYTVFYRNVSEVFGRDVVEFDIPKEFDEYVTDENENESELQQVEDIKNEEEIIIEDTVKIPFKINDETDDYENFDEDYESEEDYEEDGDNDEVVNINTYDDIIDNVIEKIEEGSDDEDFDIFGDKYKEIDFSETIEPKKKHNKNVLFEDDYEDEEPLFEGVKKIKSKRSNEIESFDLTKEEKEPNVIVKKLRKINSVKKKKTESDIW